MRAAEVVRCARVDVRARTRRREIAKVVPSGPSPERDVPRGGGDHAAEGREDWNRAPRAGCLRARNVNDSARKVDVLGTKREGLALPKAEADAERNEGATVRLKLPE